MDTVRWVEGVEAQAEANVAAARLPRALTVLFDPACALCQRSRDWMLRQETYVTLRFVACSGEEARACAVCFQWARIAGWQRPHASAPR